MMVETSTPTERELVESWRLHTLISVGYPLDLAAQIARSNVDLHKAVELTKQGCSFEVAADILL